MGLEEFQVFGDFVQGLLLDYTRGFVGVVGVQLSG
jgi:hypothetical protein